MRTNIGIRATNVSDPSEVHEFATMVAAAQWQGTVHRCTIKYWAKKKAIAHGYKWEFTQEEEPGTEDIAGATPDVSTFTFRECVESIFNGGQVRVTDDVPKRASVFDIIALVIGDTSNPRMIWQRLCAESADVVAGFYHIFPGAGQRPTPVTDAQGVMRLVNALPGRRARQFRASAMDTLVRFLAGDSSLHAEIDDNAARQAALPEGHAMHMFSEAAYANPRCSKYILRSPFMQGRYINEFYNKPVVYLLEFTHGGKSYIKVGYSMDFKERIADHFVELPGCTIYTIVVIDNPQVVESGWKEAFGAYNDRVDVNGSIKTELFTGVSLEEGEAYLKKLCEEARFANQNDRELAIMQMRMAHELALKDRDIEIKRLELQILQLQSK